jgi:hypothetical protein
LETFHKSRHTGDPACPGWQGLGPPSRAGLCHPPRPIATADLVGDGFCECSRYPAGSFRGGGTARPSASSFRRIAGKEIGQGGAMASAWLHAMVQIRNDSVRGDDRAAIGRDRTLRCGSDLDIGAAVVVGHKARITVLQRILPDVYHRTKDKMSLTNCLRAQKRV